MDEKDEHCTVQFIESICCFDTVFIDFVDVFFSVGKTNFVILVCCVCHVCVGEGCGNVKK